jgi:hypothetical protein
MGKQGTVLGLSNVIVEYLLLHIPKVLVVDFLPDIIYRNTFPWIPHSNYSISRLTPS